MSREPRFKDKVAIITGGASGIGRAACRILAGEGAKLMIADIKFDAARQVADEISGQGHEAVAMKVNVSNFDEANQMVKATLDRFDKIDILANIAGGAIPAKVGPFAQSAREVWELNIGVNLYGVMNCCRAVVNHMIERRSGKIVNAASVAGLLGQANTADYAAAKGGVIAFTKSLAKELAPYGINVNCFSPGTIGSERVLSLPEDFKKRILSTVHLRRFGTPEEAANVLVFLVSDEASYITGANYVVDGGTVLSY